MRHPAQTTRPRSGYTLIELLTTLVVLGILIGLAAPSLTAFINGIRVASVLNHLRGDINYARMVAVRSGRPVEVRFAPNVRDTCIERYQVVILSGAERVAKETVVGDGMVAVCLSHNNASRMVFNSRGFPARVISRTFHARRGSSADSLVMSQAGRLLRVE